MEKKIRLSDLNEKPCSRYYYHILETYGADGEFDPMEVFENVPGGVEAHDVSWLMSVCEKLRTPEMVEYYKSLNPTYYSVRQFITDCEFAQTKEMLEYYMGTRPTQASIALLMYECEFVRNNRRLLKHGGH